MSVIAEEGTPVAGQRVHVDKETPMEEGVIYEFHYQVLALPLGWPFENLRAFVLSKWSQLVARFKGLQILWWRLTEEEFIWQGKGISQSLWQTVALSVVAVALQGLLLVAGVVIILKSIFQIIPSPLPDPRKWWWAYLLGGVAFLGVVFGVGYFKGRVAK